MNFQQAIAELRDSLEKHQPDKLTCTWIIKQNPRVYRYIRTHVRTELNAIDWDKVTGALPPEFQRRWASRIRRPRREYEDREELALVLEPYRQKLYVFINYLDEEDKCLRDTISIVLVRLAQNGNVCAKQMLIPLLRYIIDEWIEHSWRLRVWRGYTDYIDEKIEGCIRCYRFTGSFIGYLFKTLEYAGRGLRPLTAFSLDETHRVTEKSHVESVIKDEETQEVKLFRG